MIKFTGKIQKPENESVLTAVKSMETKVDEIFARKNGEKFFNIKDELTGVMFDKFGIFRDNESMVEGLDKINKLQERFSHSCIKNRDTEYNQALIQFLELDAMLKIAEVVALGAIERKESRGSHKRSDYPDRDDKNFLKHTMVKNEDSKLILNHKNVTLGMFEPKERVY